MPNIYLQMALKREKDEMMSNGKVHSDYPSLLADEKMLASGLSEDCKHVLLGIFEDVIQHAEILWTEHDYALMTDTSDHRVWQIFGFLEQRGVVRLEVEHDGRIARELDMEAYKELVDFYHTK